jgi:NAD(P)H-dependent FMN reductase
LVELGVESSVISLENFDFPLFGGKTDVDDTTITGFVDDLSKTSGFIFCAPEYNGGVPPVLSNAITWVTVKTPNWRDAFLNKFALIATASGGQGYRFLTAFRSQLEHLGVNVLARTISHQQEKPLKEDSVKKILQGLIDLSR